MTRTRPPVRPSPIGVLVALAIGGALAAPAAPPQLLGRWMHGTSSFTGLYDERSGRWTPLNTIGFWLEFRPDGTYERQGASQLSSFLSSCSKPTTITFWHTGTYKVQGATLTLTPTRSASVYEDPCAKRRTERKDFATPERLEWSVAKTDEGGPFLRLKDADEAEGLQYHR